MEGSMLEKQFHGGLNQILETVKLAEERLKEITEREKKWKLIDERIQQDLKQSKERMRFDIRGRKYTISKEHLLRWKDTYFYALMDTKFKPDEKDCYFIDRNPQNMDLIFDYFQCGELDLNGLNDHQKKKLYEDLDYFQIPKPEKPASLISKVTFDLSRKNPRVNISNNVLSINTSSALWATIFGLSHPVDAMVMYWEIQVQNHGGAGHIRVGIANRKKFNLESYVGGVDSLSIYPGNVIQGQQSVNHTFQDNAWNTGDIIGMLFDRKNGIMRLYKNGQFVAEAKGIPDSLDWDPAFTVHCSSDQLKLMEEVKYYPNDYNCIN
eukprot:TRINITY_DN4339_c4_g1_i2.p1 TRINITY_DN4339_c4_g1~~TRINITY_DN4339_c4_g1_i2.p1  ORF type:complete len:323 (+),score=65.66 TRINITY_DN4339_c4_g1_i2:42-1010(+)